MLEILGEIDRGHPSAAQLVLDRVTVSQGGLQTGEKIGHVAAQKPSDNIIGAGTERSQRAPVAAGGVPPPPATPPPRNEGGGGGGKRPPPSQSPPKPAGAPHAGLISPLAVPPTVSILREHP